MKNQYPALLLLFLLISIKTSAQICSGTINTVWQDDFGSGTPQLSVQTSPNITSGYTYEDFGVHEGHYSLVNKFDYFSSWHFIPEDHTPNDTGGYFLVIDGNNSVPLFYETTVRNICPFRQYSFSTYAMNTDLPSFPSNQTFTFIISDTLGNQLATWDSPPIPATDNPQWVQLGFSFTSGNNTVLKLQARFNQTGYDDFAFDDFQFSVCGPTLAITTPVTGNTCVDSIPLFSNLGSGYASPVYQWQKKNAAGVFVNIPGAASANYTDHSPADTNVYSLVVGDGSLSCPIIETKEVIVSSVKKSNINTSICNGSAYEAYTGAGVYIDTFVTANGCDSIRTLNLTVTDCNSQFTGKIINDYAAATAYDPCTNKFTVDDAGNYNAGDTVLVIQMKGAPIITANTIGFGAITSYNSAGSHEYNLVKSKAGNVIELKNMLLHSYDVIDGKVQLVRVPLFQTITLTDTLTCLPWNGSKGGVLVLNAAGAVTLNAPIDVSKRGFRGGGIGFGFSCGSPDWAAATGIGGTKGEGITNYVAGKEAGGGHLANGGGGAFSANSGAGGGGNFGKGGLGGYEYNGCSAAQQGIGGEALNYITGNRVFAGGGGGGGQQDEAQGVVPGGKGGGIVILNAASLISNNQKIKANGENITAVINDEGGSGGGAGGSILLFAGSYSGDLSIETNGGSGSSNKNILHPEVCHGPGGGGSGGYVGFSSNVIPPGVTVSSIGGKAGIIMNTSSACYNTTGGAEDGAAGGNNFNIPVPVAAVPFVKNIDSVKISYSNQCKRFDFKSTSYTNTDPIRLWEWSFGDGGFAGGQDTAHIYSITGTRNVTLVVTDNYGCKDSASITVSPDEIGTSFTKTIADTAVCKFSPVQLTTSGAVKYAWTPAAGLSDTTINSPLATPVNTTNYIVTGTDADGCVSKDTVALTVKPIPLITKTSDTLVCRNRPVQLFAAGGTSYTWSPSNGLDNPNVSGPIATVSANTIYQVTVTNTENCSTADSIRLTVKSPSIFTVTPDTTTCAGSFPRLTATGGDSYLWSPAALVNDASSGNPVALATSTNLYTVKIKESTCNDSAILSTTLTVRSLPTITVSKSNDISCSAGAATLTATGASIYKWSPATGLNDPTDDSPVATPFSTTIYTVTGTASNGCSDSSSVTLEVNFTGKANYFLPSAFTPNGDGINDCYGIKYFDLVQQLEFIIYNRFGEKVFHTNDPGSCWNGMFKGKPATPGNYIYYFKAITACGPVEKKGNLLLLH